MIYDRIEDLPPGHIEAIRDDRVTIRTGLVDEPIDVTNLVDSGHD